MAGIDFPEAQLNTAARAYLSPFAMTPLAYAKAQGMDTRDAALFIGRMWVKALPAGEISPADVLRGLAQSCAAANMQVISFDGDDSHADLTMALEPDHAGNLQLLGLTEEEGDQFWEFMRPQAEARNLRYDWRREGDRIHFTCTK